MASDERDNFMRAKALVGEDYVILSRVQLDALMQWSAAHPKMTADPRAAFVLWVADYALIRAKPG